MRLLHESMKSPSKLIYYLFPYIENLVYDKIMFRKINYLESKILPLSYMDGYEKLSMEEMERFYFETLEYKKALEDKAKASLFSVSISITLIVSFIDQLFKIEHFRILSAFLVIFAIINMMLAAKMAFDVIGKLNIVDKLSPSEFHQKKRVKKERLAYATEYNAMYNIIRNNYVYSSYDSIKISLFAIAIVGILYMVGKGLASAQQDKQTELLTQMNANFVQITKVLDQMHDKLDKMNDVLNGSQKPK